MPAVFDPSKPFSPVDEALAGTTPASASPVDAVLAPPVKPAAPAPAATPAPVFDPTQPFTPAPEGPKPGATAFDPSATFTKQFSPDDVRAQDVNTLDKEKDFEPTDFGLQHEAELNADPELKKKVLEIYRKRSQDFRDLKDLANETASHPLKSAYDLAKGGLGIAKDIGVGVYQVGKNLNEALNPFVVLPRLAGHASVEGVKAGLNTTLNEAARSAAEIPTSVEANITGLSNLGRKTVREITEKAAAIDPTGFVRDVTGAKPKSELTEKEWRARYEDDVAGKKAAVDAVRGQGYLMQALGLNADELKEAGIEIRPDVVAKLQPATDPLNFVLLGEGTAVGAVGKVGGRFVVEEIAKTATKQEASILARALNATAEAAGKVTTATGEGAEKLGSGLREKIFKPLHNLGDVTGVAVAAGGHGPTGLGIIAVTKMSARALELAGRGLQKVGAVVPAATRLAADVGLEGVKGFGEGLLLTAPFTIGADPTEREALLHAAALGGLARAGVRAGGLAGKAAAIVAQEKLAQHIFRQVEQAPKPEEFTYGTDPKLDAMHTAQLAKVPEIQQKFLGWARNLFKDSFEIYVGDTPSFKENVGTDSAFGSTIKVGQTITPEGKVKPLIRIFLNGDTEALPHELMHALADLDVPGAKEFISEVNKTLTPGEKKYFEQVYNARLNPGKPQAFWNNKLSPKGLSTEIAAEVFSRIILGQDLSGVAPSVMKKATLYTSRILEKMGVSLGNVAAPGAKPGPGRSTLGIRPTAEATKLGQAFVEKVLAQNKERGNVLPEVQPKSDVAGGTLVPGEISRVKPKVTPTAPTPATPAGPTPTPSGNIPTGPTPAPAPKTPTGNVSNPPLPKEPKNIRTTREKQNDFASARAEVTKVDEARAAAEKTGDPNTVARVDEISKSMEAGNPVLEIEHAGVKNEAAAPTGRTNRREEQEAAYIAEGLGAAPKDVRDTHQKTFVPVRWEIVGGKPQLIAMSLDKVIANVHKIVTEAADHNSSKLIPYPSEAGVLSEAGWNDVVRDLQSYAENQSNGYRGDGGTLVRPPEDLGLSIPAENPAYNPVQIPEAKANFLNLIQGLNPPLTAREVRGVVPGNIKGQIIAEANARPLLKPSVIRPQDITKQTFKSQGRDIKEMNPLRNELAAAGAKVRELIEVTERINAGDITKVTPRPDINFKAPVTDIVRGGLLPGGPDFFKHNTVDEIGAAIQKANPEEWQKLATDMGSLTQGAYKLGVNLKDVADVAKLREFEAQAVKDYAAAKANKDFDAMFPAATKKQFFTEALETATGISPSKRDTIARVLGKDWKPPFPEEAKGKLLPKGESFNPEKSLEEAKRLADEARSDEEAAHAQVLVQQAEEGLQNFKGQLLPKVDEPRAVQSAAVRDKESGEIFSGPTHGAAMRKASDAAGIPKEEFSLSSSYANPNFEQGFVTQGGDFLTRAEARNRVEELGQIAPENLAESTQHQNDKNLEAVGFEHFRKFLPGKPRSERQVVLDQVQKIKDAIEQELETAKGVRGYAGYKSNLTALSETLDDATGVHILSPLDALAKVRKMEYAMTSMDPERNIRLRTIFDKIDTLRSIYQLNGLNFETPSGVGILGAKPLSTADANHFRRELMTRFGLDWGDATYVTDKVFQDFGFQDAASSVPFFHRIGEIPGIENRKAVDQALSAFRKVNMTPADVRMFLAGKTLRELAPRGKLLPGAESYEGLRQGLLPDPKPADNVPDAKIRTLAARIATEAGVDYQPARVYASINSELSKRLADFYEKAKSDPANPAVAASYAALAEETMKQYRAIVAAGYKFEPYKGEGEPYKSSADAVADVRDNKHLYVLRTDKVFGSPGDQNKDNPMLAPSGVKGLPTINDVFRGVHDFFGHAKEGYQFGPRGEFNAWRAHSEMYSPEAQGALAAETLAQNSWVNFGQHLRNGKGEIPAKGEEGYVPLADRPFGEQKAIVIPDDLINEARKAASQGAEKGVVTALGQLLPQKKLTADDIERLAVKSAAVKLDNGKVYEGPMHFIAMEKALEENPKYKGDFDQGFTTGTKGEFLNSDQALVRAEDIQQLKPFTGLAKSIGYLESEEFRKNRKFLPAPRKEKVERDFKGRPLKPDGTIDYARFFAEDPKGWAKDQDERQASVEPGEEINWPVEVKLPPTQLEQKKKLKDTVGGVLRLIHYSNAEGLKQVDPKFLGRAYATPTDLSGGQKSFFFVDGSGIGADLQFFKDANKYGALVDGDGIYDYSNDPQGFRKIVNREEQDDAIRKAGYAGFRTQTRDGRDVVALYKPVKVVPLPKVKGKLLPGKTEGLPGLNVPSEDKAQQQIRARVNSAKKQYPEALKLTYQRDNEGKYIVGENGLGKPVAMEYNLSDSPLADAAGKGLKGDDRLRAFEKALGDKLTKEGEKALKNPKVEAGRKWYSTARTRLKNLFGDDTKMFTELLAATSPRTGVEINYKFALEAYNQFKQGKYDDAIRKYREGKEKWARGDVQDFLEESGSKNPTRGQFLDWWAEKNNIVPLQSNGKRFGMNSRQVLRVLDGSWAESITGPKTPNFQGNLAGTTFEATIDIWAARALHRLAHEGSNKPWRILPLNETGVADKDFYIGQAAFRHAAEKLGMKPDALQAVLWFAEKERWEKNGWTGSQGAEKSDYNSLLKETEPAGAGTFKLKGPQRGLELPLEASDIKSKK